MKGYLWLNKICESDRRSDAYAFKGIIYNFYNVDLYYLVGICYKTCIWKITTLLVWEPNTFVSHPYARTYSEKPVNELTHWCGCFSKHHHKRLIEKWKKMKTTSLSSCFIICCILYKPFSDGTLKNEYILPTLMVFTIAVLSICIYVIHVYNGDIAIVCLYVRIVLIAIIWNHEAVNMSTQCVEFVLIHFWWY